MKSPYQMLATMQKQVDEFDAKSLDERMDTWYAKKQQQNRWKNVKSSYYHPKENAIFYGEYEDEHGRLMPSFEQKVYDLNKAQKLQAIATKKASLNAIEAALLDPWTDEFRNDAQVMTEFLKKYGDGKINWRQIQTESAGAMTMSDFPGLRIVSVLGQLVNQEQKKYVLQDAFPVVPTTELMLRIPTVSRFEIAEGMDEFDIVESMKMAFTQQFIQLKKDVAHLAWSDEFMMATFDQPIYALHLQNAQSEFERVKAAKVARQLLLLTPQVTNPGADLLAFTTGTEHSSYNPILSFSTARSAIDAGNGVMDRAAMNTYTYQAYTLNTYIGNSALSPQASSEQVMRRVISLPKAPDLTAYLDELMPNGKMALWDSSSGVRVQSIIKSSTYRDEHPGGSGLYIRDWNGAFFLRPLQGVLLTSLVS